MPLVKYCNTYSKSIRKQIFDMVHGNLKWEHYYTIKVVNVHGHKHNNELISTCEKSTNFSEGNNVVNFINIIH